MSAPYNISGHCIIRNNQVVKNDKLLFEYKGNDGFSAFIKEVYREFNFQYPKFFKMDNLCKLGFTAAELLLEKDNSSANGYENLGVIMSNSNSSLDIDLKHQQSIVDRSNYFPSPSVFVYTLPNIIIGEVCIRHHIKGENACFVAEKFDAQSLVQYAKCLFSENKMDACIVGWVDYFKDNYEAALFFVDGGKDKKVNFEPEILKEIYLKNK